MRPLPLLACLAATAAASAAELKDPAIVARDWHQTIEKARRPLLSPGPLGLTVPEAGAVTFESGATKTPPRPRRSGDVVEVPADRLGDSRMVKVVPGEMPPPGAKPWYYRGQKFWLIPIAADDRARTDGK